MNQNTKVEPFYDIPYLLTVHDVNFMIEYTGEALQKRQKRFEKKLKRSDAVVYISEFAKKMTHQYFTVAVPEYVIYNGNPIQDTLLPDQYAPAILPEKPFLFFVGEFQERKNIHTLVKMLPYLPEVDLILAGKNTGAYAEKVATLVKELNLSNRVHTTGKISDQDKRYYYQNCLGFCFPSLREGFGIPPIEAMAFGKPVFLSDKTSLPEIGGEHAFYWNTFEPKSMANVLTAGLEAYERDQSFYQKKYVERAAGFDWKESAKKYLKVYRTLL